MLRREEAAVLGALEALRPPHDSFKHWISVRTKQELVVRLCRCKTYLSLKLAAIRALQWPKIIIPIGRRLVASYVDTAARVVSRNPSISISLSVVKFRVYFFA